MLSNKLTFSLVLALMLAFAFIATPAIAQNAPAVTGIASGTFIVLGQEGAGAANGIGTLTPAVEDVDFPINLADVLRFGGTIEVLVSADNYAGIVAEDDAAAAQKKADAVKNAVIVSEIMWGLDLSGTTDALRRQSQWIELYVHSKGSIAADTVAGDIQLRISATRMNNAIGTLIDLAATPTAELTDDEIVVDVVSTVDRFGSLWAAKGNSGNTAALGAGTTGIPATDLVSMYRKINLDDAGMYKKNDEGALDGLGDGTAEGSWEASSGRVNLTGGFVGTPGIQHRSVGGAVKTFAKSPGSLAGTGVIINEVRNDASEANLDWVEFFNNTDPSAADSLPTQIENWTLSLVTRTPKSGKTEDDDPTGDNFDYADGDLFSLPKYKFQPGDYLVVYNRDPGETILAGGVDLDAVIAGEQVNKGSTHMYVVRDFSLPDDKKFSLILRNGNDKAGTHEKIVDFAGNGFFSRVEDNKFNTDFWPLIAWSAPGDVAAFGDNSFAGNMSWGRKTSDLNDMGMHWPKSRADNRTHKEDWESFEFVGSGYDRDVDPNSAPGTPGYANWAVNVIADDRDNEAMKSPYAFGGAITISEVMYDARHPRDLVQWIELYNSSSNETINLDGWRMEIRNIADGKVESYVDSGFDFDAHTKVLPNQTLLLVSRTGPSSVPRTRVYDLNQRHRTELGLQRRDKVLLSSEGFYIELQAKVMVGGEEDMMTVDTAGNLMVDGATRTKQWDLPPVDGEGPRTSIVRQYDAGAAADGSMEDSWKVSEFAGLAYYGHRDDTGTPGYRRGGPLPVSLSSFRPVRNQTTGHVDIRWITESELNNAGFNILRAEGKDGEFTVINLQGIIAGHGTTSEKHVYTFTDKTAKPNVVYYYQIEDVSLNGNRTTLATTHMRGNVSAAGKVTTTWGDLKLQK